VFIVAAPAFAVLWWRSGLRALVGRLALVGLAALVVMVPWAVRSTRAMDEPVALSLNLGDNLCLGHNPGATGGFVDISAHCYTGEGSGLVRPEIETRRQSENIDRAVTYARENPGTTLRRTVSKARITLESDADGLRVAEDFGVRPLVSDASRDVLRGVADGFYVAVRWRRSSGRCCSSGAQTPRAGACSSWWWGSCSFWRRWRPSATPGSRCRSTRPWPCAPR